MPNCSPVSPVRVIALTVISWHTQTPLAASTRVLLAVEPHARPLLNLVCTQLMASRNRSFSLVLAQVNATRHVARQQEVSQRRILDNFQSLAHGGWVGGRGLLWLVGFNLSRSWSSLVCHNLSLMTAVLV